MQTELKATWQAIVMLEALACRRYDINNRALCGATLPTHHSLAHHGSRTASTNEKNLFCWTFIYIFKQWTTQLFLGDIKL